MKSTMTTRLMLTLALALAATALGGCNIIGPILYVFAPSDDVTVGAEFNKLEGNTVAILIVAGDEYVKNYDYFREQLIMVTAKELKTHLDDVKTIDANRVVNYQKAHADWNTTPEPTLAAHFGADYLLKVTISDYALRLPGSATLYRGTITAEAELFDASKPLRESRVLWSQDITAAYPEDDRPLARIGGGGSKLRYELDKRFAVALVRRFRTHKIKAKDGFSME